MGQIRVGSQFFKRARREYRDWAKATIRELAQNSQDAHCSRMTISVSEIDSGRSKIVWSDDGVGMDRKTLEDVFFALGETTKGGNDTGGFGKARELTCFSMERYGIRTQNLNVEGSGDQYDIVETDDNFSGCVFEIDIDSNASFVRSAIIDYFKDCNPRCSVFLDGTKVKDFAKIGDHRRDLSFGQVFVNEKDKSQRCVFRVNGLYMFERWTEAKASIFIEMDSSRSRQLLTANRDGITSYDANREVDSFMNELSIDVFSAIRKRMRLMNDLVEGKEGFLEIKSLREKKADFERIVAAATAQMAASSGTITVDKNALIEDALRLQAERDSRIDLFNVKMIDETELTEEFTKMRAVRAKYDPRNWKVAYVQDKRTGEQRPYNVGGNLKKLLVMWKSACECCLEILNEAGYVSDIKWSVGWYFCKDRDACCTNDVIDGNSVYFYCLRPVDLNGKMAYSITSKQDLHKIIWLALHETIHTIQDYHDERYANLFTEFAPVISVMMRDIIARMEKSAVFV